MAALDEDSPNKPLWDRPSDWHEPGMSYSWCAVAGDWKCMVCHKIATDDHMLCKSHTNWKAHFRQRPPPTVAVGPTVAAVAAVQVAAVPAPVAAVPVADWGAAAAAQAATPPPPPPTPPPLPTGPGVNEWLRLQQTTSELSRRIDTMACQLELLTTRVDRMAANLAENISRIEAASSSSTWWPQQSQWDSK